MGNVFDDLRIAARWLRVVGAGSQRRGGCKPCPFLSHSFHLALLCLGELRGDDHEAEVDHKERANLKVVQIRRRFESRRINKLPLVTRPELGARPLTTMSRTK